MRQFTPGPSEGRIYHRLMEIRFRFGPQILFQATAMENLIVSAEICEDVWSPIPPSIGAALEGATVIVNCSASDETIGKDSYRRELISGQSARLIAGYVYANAGEGESTTDLVFGGHNIIAENGTILKRRSAITMRSSTRSWTSRGSWRRGERIPRSRQRKCRTLIRVPFLY